MAFIRGSIAALGAGAAALDMPGEAGAAFMAPGLAHAVARVETDKPISVRKAVMVNSWGVVDRARTKEETGDGAGCSVAR